MPDEQLLHYRRAQATAAFLYPLILASYSYTSWHWGELLGADPYWKANNNAVQTRNEVVQNLGNRPTAACTVICANDYVHSENAYKGKQTFTPSLASYPYYSKLYTSW